MLTESGSSQFKGGDPRSAVGRHYDQKPPPLSRKNGDLFTQQKEVPGLDHVLQATFSWLHYLVGGASRAGKTLQNYRTKSNKFPPFPRKRLRPTKGCTPGSTAPERGLEERAHSQPSPSNPANGTEYRTPFKFALPRFPKLDSVALCSLLKVLFIYTLKPISWQKVKVLTSKQNAPNWRNAGCETGKPRPRFKSMPFADLAWLFTSARMICSSPRAKSARADTTSDPPLKV